VGSLLINQHAKRSGSNPASRFPLSFLGGQYYIFIFLFLFLFYLGGIKVRTGVKSFILMQLMQTFLDQQQARDLKISFDGFDGIC
jgi:hypothetical protein